MDVITFPYAKYLGAVMQFHALLYLITDIVPFWKKIVHMYNIVFLQHDIFHFQTLL